ncbi:hypothetical protein NEIRO03_1911 [Nematocida sp. AWRm78]|nr:hypothetical protein NEIRO03_1911 [Nematocida sp. AWRm78]
MKNEKTIDALTNLVDNIYCVQLCQRYAYMSMKGMNIIENDNLIKEKSSMHACMVIDIIMEEAEKLDSKDKKEAFYELMRNNHMIIALLYKYRKKFYDNSINVLCEKEHMPKLYDKITAEDAMIKMCELTDSGECSRFQRALDILVKHGNNLSIVDENGIEHSNASKLGISKDDIYSLQLLTKIDKWVGNELIEFLIYSIYGSIYSFYKNNIPIKPYFSIYSLYSTVFSMAIYIDENENELGIGLEEYKKIVREKIKKALDELKTINSIECRNTILDCKMYNDIKDYNKNHTKFNISRFKTNVIKNYISYVSTFASIIGEHNRLFNMQPIKDFLGRNRSELTLVFLSICVVGVNLSSYLKLRQNM